MCCPPQWPAASLPELAKVILEVVLDNPRTLVLWDVNIHIKAGLAGHIQNFMTTMATIALPQHIVDTTFVAGHFLVLVLAGHSITPLSWKYNFLVKFGLMAAGLACMGEGPIKMVCPRRLMESKGFLNVLGAVSS